MAKGRVHQAISRLNPLNMKRGTLQIGSNCFAPDCDSPLDTLSFVTSGRFPVARAVSFPSARSPNEEGVSGLSLSQSNPSFCATPAPRAGRR